MDPLSITVSVLTILGSSGSVGKAVKKLMGLRSLPDALLALNNEISDFHLVVSKTDALLRSHQSTPDTSSRITDFATELSPLLARGKVKLLELECLIEYNLTRPGQHGVSVLNKVAWLREQDKVRTIQDEIRSIRTSLATLIGIFASSTALRTEIQLSELRLISNNIMQSQRQGHAMTSQILARQSATGSSHGRTEPMLQELILTQRAHHTFVSQRGSSFLSDGIFAPAWPRPDGRLSLGLEVANLTHHVRWNGNRCQCLCHTKYAWRSPGRLKQLFGLLFLGYSGMPTINAACERCVCRQNRDATVVIRYVFPAWFVARVLYFSLRVSTLNGIEQVLKVSTFIPSHSKFYEFINKDNTEGFKIWLSAGECSPFGVDEEGLTLLDVGFSQ